MKSAVRPPTEGNVPKFIVLIALIAAALFNSGLGLAAPPKVVKAVPDNGDADVDPNLREIRITFDQPMGKGMSVVGGGDSFPELLGQPRWESARTIVVRVRLKPNHDYWISVNSDRFQNFTNRNGEVAEVYPIQFRTGAGSGIRREDASDSEMLTPRENRRALNLLRTALRDHYSYRDRLKIDWDEVLKSQEGSLLAAKSPTDFARAAGTILAQAKDKHIWFEVDGELIPSFVRPGVPNANYKLLPQLVPELKKHGRAVVSGRWDDGIGYLAIGTWERAKLEDGKSVSDGFDAVADTKALVIDVRANGGGDERLAQDLAGSFIAQRVLYAKHVYRDPTSPGGFTPPRERWLEPNPNRPRYTGAVAVLSGPVVMSSCEGFLKMMKQVPGAVIVGAASQGSSGNPKPHDLRNGVTVFLPSWKDMLPDGREIEGVGIPPDVEVKAVAADFAAADPVLDAALAQLRTSTTN
jgi:hypothetical protein